ncbi:MAG TPA: dihydrofolate reductase family protein [Streptosporangiaceae bacterium]|jgi:dihydrofolate reductase|nr:dihydrofolate reductase family protein [Streptosporangiaceae bacterium]
MRKVIVSSYATLDGKVDDLQEWVSPWNGDTVAAYHEALLADSDGLLLGRTTYQVFAMIWPPRSGQLAYADKINSMAKHVASTTLTDADLAWENSHLIEGGVADGVAKLKEQPGGDLVVYGGPGLVSTLQEHDLVDEYRVMVHPVLLGKGRGLVKDGGPRVNLDLVDTTVIRPGVAILTYRPVR